MQRSAAPPALAIDDLVFQFDRREGPAPGNANPFTLRIRHFTLARGEEVLLTGGSGTGKSTLLQLIAGLLNPLSGRVLIDGQDIHQLHGGARDHLRGRAIGMIFQTFQLALGFTALENVQLALLFGRPDRSVVPERHEQRAKDLLQQLGIERTDALVETLSVGQQQRVAVARALACRPPLVLADEPTASLDPENAANAVALIRATCREQGASLICVSHDPTLIPGFGRHEQLSRLLEPTAAPALSGSEGGQ